MKGIYKTPHDKEKILALYEEKLKSLDFLFMEKDVETAFGRTRVIVSGNDKGKKIVMFHGIHAGSPLSLECIKNLLEVYKIYAIDTIGQATKSAETKINIKDNSFALWADEVLDGLSIEYADFIGISYGAYILQKLITHQPQKVGKCIFIVPGGLANGDFWPSLKNLSLPLIKFQITIKDKNLKKFLRHFVPEDDKFMFAFQRAILTGLHMDYRRPQILQKGDVEHFTNPVYIIVADDDIFFPAEKVFAQAEKVFKNLKEVHYLKNCKHMPNPSHFVEIENKIRQWID